MEEGDGFGISPLQMGLMLLLLFIFMYWLVYKDYKSEKNAERQTWNRLSYKSSERKRDREIESAERESAERASVDAVVAKKKKANERERALDYDSAIEIWEDLGKIKEAARVRKLKTEEGSVKVTQKVVHGDEVTKTEIKDSVVSKSNVGAGGKSKAEDLREAKSLFEEGLIDESEYKQMKKEILGK